MKLETHKTDFSGLSILSVIFFFCFADIGIQYPMGF